MSMQPPVLKMGVCASMEELILSKRVGSMQTLKYCCWSSRPNTSSLHCEAHDLNLTGLCPSVSFSGFSESIILGVVLAQFATAGLGAAAMIAGKVAISCMVVITLSMISLYLACTASLLSSFACRPASGRLGIVCNSSSMFMILANDFFILSCDM